MIMVGRYERLSDSFTAYTIARGQRARLLFFRKVMPMIAK
jgi:hypothetical protein